MRPVSISFMQNRRERLPPFSTPSTKATGSSHITPEDAGHCPSSEQRGHSEPGDHVCGVLTPPLLGMTILHAPISLRLRFPIHSVGLETLCGP